MKALIVSFACLFSTIALAAPAAPQAVVHPCGYLNDATLLRSQIKDYSNAGVGVTTALTMNDDGSYGTHILVLIYNQELPGGTCYAISKTDKVGFEYAGNIQGWYDSSQTSVYLSFDVGAFDPNTNKPKVSSTIKVLANPDGANAVSIQ